MEWAQLPGLWPIKAASIFQKLGITKTKQTSWTVLAPCSSQSTILILSFTILLQGKLIFSGGTWEPAQQKNRKIPAGAGASWIATRCHRNDGNVLEETRCFQVFNSINSRSKWNSTLLNCLMFHRPPDCSTLVDFIPFLISYQMYELWLWWTLDCRNITVNVVRLGPGQWIHLVPLTNFTAVSKCYCTYLIILLNFNRYALHR